jgi:hypothetical protein
MAEAGDRPRLPLEALAQVGAGREVRGEHLDRDGAIQPRVTRAVHLPHAAGAERGEDLVRA